MSDTPSHVSVSSPSLSKSLPFFATLASVKPGVNYGPIINVAGFPFSWTLSGYEPSSGALPFETLSSLLSTAPKPGMRATALDAPGSMLFEVGGKWGGDPGVFTSTTDPNYIAYMAAIAAQTVVPSAVILTGTTPATAVAMEWDGYLRYRSKIVKLFSGVASFLYLPGAGLLGGNMTGKTFAAKFPCPRKFSGFRIKIPSGDSAVVKYTYAISTSATDDGSALTWTVITFAGSATVTRSSAGYLTSDVMPAITDTASKAYIYIRAYSESGTFSYVDPSGQYWPSGEFAAFGEFSSRWGLVDGDKSISGAVVCGSNNWGMFQIVAADFYGEDCFTVGCVGDSLDQGWSVNGGTSTESNWRMTAKYAAKALQERGFCAGYYSLALAGEAHLVSCAKIPAQFYGNDTFADFLILRSWSPNSGVKASALIKSITETKLAINKVLSYGGTPIVATPTPCGATGEKEQYRIKASTFSLDVRHGGIPCDIASAVANPARPSEIAAEYLDTSGNTTHFNTAGYNKIGDTYAAKIAEVLAYYQ